MDTITFIDLSNYVFHRYFALQSWCKIAQKELDKDAFREKYKALFIKNLQTMQKKLKFNWKSTYFARDCWRGVVWRKQLYPEYKGNRDKRVDSFDPTIFDYTYDEIMPELMEKYGCCMLQYACAEADDIVAVAHKKVRSIDKEIKVIIITNDNDYLQLLDDNTYIANCKLLELKSRFTQEELDHFGLLKVIVGDKSDNIPPIQKKIGNKTALQLCLNRYELEEKLCKSTECRSAFNLNENLILFDKIPLEMEHGIWDLFIYPVKN